jgi:1-aminocyclopropane-1-carboxylate deaminase/D-cysteine desulfhydrase-like pyridoxal-dependent ACC family enzyme
MVIKSAEKLNSEILNKIDLEETPLQKIHDFKIENSDVELFVYRLDLIHPEISGNKWFKLKYNLIEAGRLGYKTLLTFGGAYSNHIYAVAAAGKIFGFDTIGIIRGEEHLPLNPTLLFAKNCGMKIQYLDRITYRKRKDEDFLYELKNKFPNTYFIPEGGTNPFAVQGCSEIPGRIEQNFDIICCPCGTGGTLAGISCGLNGNHRALGFSILKDGEFLRDNVQNLVKQFTNKTKSNWEINLNYHFGGYAKINKELIVFIEKFEEENNILLDPIYSGKMMFGMYDLIKKNYFKNGEKIIAIHTGGLQGLEGMKGTIEKTISRK